MSQGTDQLVCIFSIYVWHTRPGLSRWQRTKQSFSR